MNIYEYINGTSEKPLDNIVMDGGFAKIFRTIACVGDSFASGEFQSLAENAAMGHHDMFEYSWGQFMARELGSTVYNFSKGGMTAKQYWNTFAEEKGYWDPEKRAQCYIIALGYNDIINQNMDVGSRNDVDCVNIGFIPKNEDSFAYYLGKIILRLKEISPNARFFFVTMPREEYDSQAVVEKKNAHAKLLHALTDVFAQSYVIDLRKYGPEYDAKFKDDFFLFGHKAPAGYMLTAKMIVSYMDYIIRHNPAQFKDVCFVGTPIERHMF